MEKDEFYPEWPGFPKLAIDIILFSIIDGNLSIVLVKDFDGDGTYYLPGNIIPKDRSLEDSFDYILEKRTGITGIYKEQLAAFGSVDRDPTGHGVTIAYMALVPVELFNQKIDLKKVEIVKYNDVNDLPLGFDHKDIIKFAKNKLDIRLLNSDIVKHIMPKYFRMSELHKTYEILLNKKFDLRNFQKKILSLGVLKDTGLKDKTIKAPAKLYEFIYIENESE